MPFKRNVYDTAVYREPTPIQDRENPFQSMVERFDVAAEILELNPGFYEYLSRPARIHVGARSDGRWPHARV
jgi:glutamate dehydrogenase (NAD(P)+)